MGFSTTHGLIFVLLLVGLVSAKPVANDFEKSLNEDGSISFGFDSHVTSCPDCRFRILSAPMTVVDLFYSNNEPVVLGKSFTGSITVKGKYKQFGAVKVLYIAQTSTSTSNIAELTITVNNQPDDPFFIIDPLYYGYRPSDSLRYDDMQTPVFFVDFDRPLVDLSAGYEIYFNSSKNGVASFVSDTLIKGFFTDPPIEDLTFLSSLETTPTVNQVSTYPGFSPVRIYKGPAGDEFGLPRVGPFTFGAFIINMVVNSVTAQQTNTMIAQTRWFINVTDTDGNVRSNNAQFSTVVTLPGQDVIFQPYPLSAPYPVTHSDVPSLYGTRIVRTSSVPLSTNYNMSMGFIPQDAGEIRFNVIIGDLVGNSEGPAIGACSGSSDCNITFNQLHPLFGAVGYYDGDSCVYPTTSTFALYNSSGETYWVTAGNGFNPNPFSGTTSLLAYSATNYSLCVKPNKDYYGPLVVSWVATSKTSVQYSTSPATSGVNYWSILPASRPPTCLNVTFDDQTIGSALQVAFSGFDSDYMDHDSLGLYITQFPENATFSYEGVSLTSFPASSTNGTWIIDVDLESTSIMDHYEFSYVVGDSRGLNSTECKIRISSSTANVPAPSGSATSIMSSMVSALTFLCIAIAFIAL